MIPKLGFTPFTPQLQVNHFTQNIIQRAVVKKEAREWVYRLLLNSCRRKSRVRIILHGDVVPYFPFFFAG